MKTLLALATSVILASCVYTKDELIVHDNGGSVYEYTSKYRELDKAGAKVIVSGFCASACTLALTTKNMCYTPNSRFLFHGVSVRGEYSARDSAVFAKKLPKGVQAWAEEVGAFKGLALKEISGAQLAKIDDTDRTCTE
jgi:ATP-dependent protease ClpP protease subunit